MKSLFIFLGMIQLIGFFRGINIENSPYKIKIYLMNIASSKLMLYKTIMLVSRKFARQGVRVQRRRRCSYLLQADCVARQRSIADFIQSASRRQTRKIYISRQLHICMLPSPFPCRKGRKPA